MERAIDLKIKQQIHILVLISILVLSACTNQNIVTNPPSETSGESLGETFGFTQFNISIDTKEMKQAIAANYDEKRDKTEAVYENKTENLFLHGDPAMDKLATIFEDLGIEPDMDAEDMVKKASEAFEVIDYTTLKLTVKFKGYDTKEMMMSK